MSFEFELNGSPVTFAGPPMTRLLDVLREHCQLTGTKEGCGEGECGSCSVRLDGDVVCACLVPVFQVHDRTVQTVESNASNGELDAVQTAFVDRGGVQCGACTPGLIVTVRALLDQQPRPDRARIRAALGGNLCRCTGYERIFQAVEAAAEIRSATPQTTTPQTTPPQTTASPPETDA